MQAKKQAIGLLALVGLIFGSARAADVYVICHADATISAADVRDVFTGEKQFAGNVKLLPADNSAVQSQFLSKVLKMDAAKYSNTWTKKSFRDGANPPPLKGSDAEVLEFVKRTAGACSYVAAAPPAGVLTIASF
jgi:hypothetical protein